MLVDQPVCDSPDDRVLSCVFYEGVQNEWLERELVLTGHSRGVVNIWSKAIRGKQFELELIRQLHHTDSSRDTGANITAGISCILALPHVVYTGDEAGRVVSHLVSSGVNTGLIDLCSTSGTVSSDAERAG